MKVIDFYPLILEAFNENKSFIFPINGTSMMPLFRPQTKVEIVKIDQIKKNDIIFYRRNDGSFILHRVIKVNDTLTMMGDHQIIKETNVSRDSCFAKVVAYYKNGKRKELKGFLYRLYLFTLNFKLFRKVYIRCLH